MKGCFDRYCRKTPDTPSKWVDWNTPSKLANAHQPAGRNPWREIASPEQLLTGVTAAAVEACSYRSLQQDAAQPLQTAYNTSKQPANSKIMYYMPHARHSNTKSTSGALRQHAVPETSRLTSWRNLTHSSCCRKTSCSTESGRGCAGVVYWIQPAGTNDKNLLCCASISNTFS
jgi:hypothetical protein